MKEYKLFAQRIGLVGMSQILIALSTFILLPIMTKNYSINDYGIYVQTITTINLIPQIATLGLPYTLLRFLSGEKNKEIIKEGFYSIALVILILTCIISLIIFVFSNNIAAYLFNNNTNIVILLVPLVFFACLNNVFINYFRTFQQIKRYSGFLILQTYSGLILVSYFALNGYDIYIAILGLLAAYSFTFFVLFSIVISEIGLILPKFKNLKEHLSFGLPTVPSNLSEWIVDSSDRYVIGIILGLSFVGYYYPGYTLAYIILLLMAPFSLLLPSVLPKYYDNDDIEKVQIFLKYSIKYFLLIAIPCVFGLSVLSKPILMIITTPEIATNGYLITPFVAAGLVFLGIYYIINNILVLEKKTKILGTIWTIMALLNLGLNLVFVPIIGIIGSAIITLVTYATAFIVTLLYSVKLFKFDFNFSFVLKSIFTSIIITIFIILINPQGILNILFVVLTSAIIYLAILLLLRGIEREEIKFFKMFLRS